MLPPKTTLASASAPRLMNLLIDDIKTFREFPLRNSRVCRFSCGGHLLAAVSLKDIAVYSTINFKRVVSDAHVKMKSAVRYQRAALFRAT